MVSLKVFGTSKGEGLTSVGPGNRPEMLRRKTIANNARLLIGIAALGMLPSMYLLMGGTVLPFIIASLMLAGGMISLSSHHNAQFDTASAVQVATLMSMGLVLTMADPRLGDAGMGMALMGPVLAALTACPSHRRASWIAMALLLILGAVASFAGIGSVGLEDGQMLIASTFGFISAFAVVAHSAHRISAAYEVHDKAQISAYRHLIEHVQDAVLRFSGDGTILLASRSSETLFGCPRYQIAGDNLSNRLHVLDRPAFLTAFADANQGGRSRTIELRMRQDNPHASNNVPRFVWVEMQLSPILEEAGPSGRYEVIALLRDITSRKDAESAMAEARRAAEDASQAKSRFLATIGHELRTPLNAVVGFSEMMTSDIGGELSSTHKEYAGLIHQSGRHLLEVVSMLLDMSRIEAGKFEVQAAPMAPGDVVPSCLAMVETLAADRKVRLEQDIEADLPLLVADERLCRQIMINLLSNAIKFSHEGGLVSVVIKRQGQSINFSVRDRGIGMAPAALARIGEPFFQAQEGLSRQYEGTGLGLSIVKGLVELHGGTLRAMSEIGAGTTITVLLPINGPETKPGETADIVHLHREPLASTIPSWQNEKRKAQ